MARLYRLSALAALATFALIVLGGVSRLQSGPGCVDWPLCQGSWLPPLAGGPIVDYLHRAISASIGLLLLIIAVLASVTAGVSRRTRVAAWSAVGLVLIQSALGAFTIDAGLRVWTGTAHLALALVLFGATLLTTAAVAADRGAPPWLASGLASGAPGNPGLHRAALLGSAALFVLLLSGAASNAAGVAVACTSWPFCPDAGASLTGGGNPINGRTPGPLLVVLAAAAIVAFVAWRGRGETGNRATGVTLALTGGLTGLLLVEGGVSLLLDNAAWIGPTLLATLTPLWGAMLVLVVLAGGRAVAPALAGVSVSGGTAGSGFAISEPAEAGVAWQSGRALIADYVALTKPGIMSLLLVTTLGGMLIALGGFPSATLALITVIGGVLAAGGANVLNCFIDRDIDAQMTRTRNRASASGRISPRAVLIFGATLTVLSVLLLWTLVNPLAAILALAGNLFYVFIYTLWLKRRTPQNIVIGGAAGAFPPLVGWAAATGNLSIVAWGLFAIVFFWTPPHFWSLALLKQGDYGRAGVPMLPNVAGEAETRKQIVLYTLLLTAVCVSLAWVGLGWIYLEGTLLVNGVFLGYALRLYARPSKATARGMFFFSLWYLVLVFGAAVIDRFILGA